MCSKFSYHSIHYNIYKGSEQNWNSKQNQPKWLENPT